MPRNLKADTKYVRIKSGAHYGTIVERESWEREKAAYIKRGETPPEVEYLVEKGPREEEGNPTVIYGWLTPPLAEELRRLMEVTEWPPPEEPSPTFSAVLQVCDYAFTLKALKRKTYEMDVGKSGHKKILIVRLLNAEEEELTDIAQRTIAELEARGLMEEAEIPLEEVTDIAKKVVGT